MTQTQALPQILQSNKDGHGGGLPSYCTAHPDVLLAIMREYEHDEAPILIEATCNQVNQYGGYTGMVPAEFADFIHTLAQRARIKIDRIILGGDHLGPNPWRDLPAEDAMEKACTLVAAYVSAGFTKIHLDASMTCADDGPLSDEVIAHRATLLCQASEDAAGAHKPSYIIGSEVPVPGGEKSGSGRIEVTDPADVGHTISAHKEAFDALGLNDAFARIVGVVTQPGVDFSNSEITHFEPEKAAELSTALSAHSGIVYEAHSTDYQNLTALSALVKGHFAILKVGPELTYAYREAVQAMAKIELREDFDSPSQIMDVVSAALDRNPCVWRDYIAPNEDQKNARIDGLSDRVRYVWQDPAVQRSVETLRHNFNAIVPDSALPLDMLHSTSSVSNYDAIVQAKVGAVVRRYRAACVGR